MLPGIDRPVLFLDKCAELAGIEIIGTGSGEPQLRIGAATTYAALLSRPEVHSALKSICSQIAAPGLRNVATIGGNICNASPAGDTLPFLYAFDAALELASSRERRMVPVAEFITGPGAIDLGPEEVLIAVRVPLWNPSVWRYRKVGTRRANALTKVSFAGFADIERGIVSRVALTFGAVGATVIRAEKLEAELTGMKVNRIGESLSRLLSLCSDAVAPIDDQRSTAVYRLNVALNLCRTFLNQDLMGAQGE
jgi:CO/xanthine dehydrogenase FAD-binding subunit